LAGLALITPTLHVARGPQDAVGFGSVSTPRSDIDPRTPSAVKLILARAPVWIVAGERELPGVDALRAAVGPRAAEIEVDVLKGFQTKALEAVHGPRVPRELTVAWAQRSVDRIRKDRAGSTR
jgi:hypothetical protein